MVLPGRRSDAQGSKVGTKLPEKVEWHGCNHQNGEASQTGDALLLGQMLKKVGKHQEKVEASMHVAKAFLGHFTHTLHLTRVHLRVHLRVH